jgi:transposase
MGEQVSKRLTATQREDRRLEAGRLLLEKTLSNAEIARRVGVSRSAITQWAQQLKKRRRGVDGLSSRRHTGRPPRLTKADWRRVLVLLRRGAVSAGFATDRWTLASIQELVRREFSVSYSKSYLSEKLRDLGWASQQPASTGKDRTLQQPTWHSYRDTNFWVNLWRRRRGERYFIN